MRLNTLVGYYPNVMDRELLSSTVPNMMGRLKGETLEIPLYNGNK